MNYSYKAFQTLCNDGQNDEKMIIRSAQTWTESYTGLKDLTIPLSAHISLYLDQCFQIRSEKVHLRPVKEKYSGEPSSECLNIHSLTVRNPQEEEEKGF